MLRDRRQAGQLHFKDGATLARAVVNGDAAVQPPDEGPNDEQS